MTFSASLLLLVFCTLPMISTLMELEEPCDKILKKVGVIGIRMRTVDCPKSIKAPLLKEIPRELNRTLIYNCRLEEIANVILQFDDRGLRVSSRMFPNVNVTKHLVSKKDRAQYSSIEAEASEFVEDAIEEWSTELEKMKTQNMSRFGCNFYDDNVENNKYELCCVFS